MNELLSHPHQTLQQHIDQVVTAARWALDKHSRTLFQKIPELYGWTMKATYAHDLGKGSCAFQKYIRDPKAFHGDPIEKAHSPLSMLLVLRLARKEDWSPLDTLIIAAAVAGHHGGMPLKHDLMRLFEEIIPTDVWKRQLSELPLEELASHTGLSVQCLSLHPDVISDIDYLEYVLLKTLDNLPLQDALKLRLNTQFVLSILLEADKAFLAIDIQYRERLQNHKSLSIPLSAVDEYLSGKLSSPLNSRRNKVRWEVLEAAPIPNDVRINTVTLPTGMGKTMIAASWALKLREALNNGEHFSKVIIVLPYLSIIDQTVEEYKKLLGDMGTSDVLMPTHSISDRVYDDNMDGSSNDYFIDTWQAPFIITTFDQFLLALFGPKSRHVMRYHNLYNALVIMDEVQTLPCRLWDPVDNILKTMIHTGCTRFLIMSATQPGFLTDAHELVTDPEQEFAQFKRYRIVLNHKPEQPLEDFTKSLIQRIPGWLYSRILITLNTRRSARYVRDKIEEAGAGPLFFISADVTPKDRLYSIEKIKNGSPCIVVSTQCVEAGVDIDMDLVIRDFGPFDTLVQIAGRCNRNGEKPRCDVEVVSLVNDQGRRFASMIYDGIQLQETNRVLDSILETQGIIHEEDVFNLCIAYFGELKKKRDTGEKVTRDFAYWLEIPSIRELLRGKQREKYEFIVSKEAPGLEDKINKALEVKDRWDRRRELRKLAGEIGRVTVSVYARAEWIPEEYACKCGPFWILKDEFYESDRGISLPEHETE